MHSRCFTAYIEGFSITFTEYSEEAAIKSARHWMKQNKLKCFDSEIRVVETTDKFIGKDEENELYEND